MSANYKNSPGYSSSDIEKYRRGELSARERHELESAALEDPFLADALEGMEFHQSLREATMPVQSPEKAALPTFDEDLALLEARLKDRIAGTTNKPSIFFLRSGTRAAAAILLLLGLGTAAYFTLLKRSPNTEPLATRSATRPADNTPSTDSASTADSRPPAETTPPAATTTSTITTTETAASKKPDRPQSHQPKSQQSEPQQSKPDRPQSHQSKPNSPKPDQPAASIAAASPAPGSLPAPSNRSSFLPLKEDTIHYQSAFGTPNPSQVHAFGGFPDRHSFTGKVLGENNQPLAGASVVLKGHTEIGTVTDQQGLFSLDLHEKDSAAKLTVAYTGYQPASLDLNYRDLSSAFVNNNNIGNLYNNTRTGNIIQLQPQKTALGEVVVTGYGQKRKETITDGTMDAEEKIDAGWLKAVPTIGREAYMDYLATEKSKLPLDSTIKGTEIISFTVNKKGERFAFKVEQSLSPAHDSSTIRLIREGPSWKLLRGRKVRTSVQLRY
jgi:hypothetical protein